MIPKSLLYITYRNYTLLHLRASLLLIVKIYHFLIA